MEENAGRERKKKGEERAHKACSAPPAPRKPVACTVCALQSCVGAWGCTHVCTAACRGSVCAAMRVCSLVLGALLGGGGFCSVVMGAQGWL